MVGHPAEQKVDDVAIGVAFAPSVLNYCSVEGYGTLEKKNPAQSATKHDELQLKKYK